MAKNSNLTLWGTLSVGQKLATIPLLFIVAIAVILTYTLVTIQDQRADAFVLDMAGRQRTLIYKHLGEALLRARGDAVPDFEQTRKMMNDSVNALINGGTIYVQLTNENKTVAPAPTEAIRQTLLDQQKELGEFQRQVDALLKIGASGNRDAQFAATRDALLKQTEKADTDANRSAKAFVAHSQEKIETMATWEMVIGVIAGLLGIAASWLISRAIVSPLGSVVNRAQEIAGGNLRGQKLAITSSDQVGQLAEVFNQMLDSLKDLAGQTVSVTNNLNAAAAEILASTQQQAAGTKEQAATVQQITTTMEEVRQSGGQISERAKQVATNAEATSSSSVSGLRAVQDTNRTMELIREQVEEVAENIVALSEKTQAVGEIIATVNDIAERSNLLALNAAIEAAAAGDQGNRFSVVANEIKNLADQAKDSTVQVRTILGDIQKGINSSVMLTEEAVKRVETGKQQADVTEQTIREMAETTQQSVQAFQQIIGATSQQQIGFEQVTQGMQDIRQAATQTAASTIQLEKAVSNLNTQSHQLREAVGRYQI